MASDLSRRAFLGAAGAATMAEKDRRQAGETSGAARIVAVSCSPNRGKNTAAALAACLEAAANFAGGQIETELLELAGKKIPGLVAAGVELEPGERDDFPSLVAQLTAPDVAGVVIGTPVYFSNMSSLAKAFLERCGEFRTKEAYLWRDKLAGVVAVGGTRNGGQEMAAQSVAAALFCQDMILVGPGQPNSRHGALVWAGAGQRGALDDEKGMAAAADLGRRMAELALRLHRS